MFIVSATGHRPSKLRVAQPYSPYVRDALDALAVRTLQAMRPDRLVPNSRKPALRAGAMTATDRLHAEILGSTKTNYGAQFMPCPACGALAECEAVDVGVGLYLRGDYTCRCGWELDGPDDWGFIGPDDRPFAPADERVLAEIMNALPEWAVGRSIDSTRYMK